MKQKDHEDIVENKNADLHSMAKKPLGFPFVSTEADVSLIGLNLEGQTWLE